MKKEKFNKKKASVWLKQIKRSPWTHSNMEGKDWWEQFAPLGDSENIYTSSLVTTFLPFKMESIKWEEQEGHLELSHLQERLLTSVCSDYMSMSACID